MLACSVVFTHRTHVATLCPERLTVSQISLCPRHRKRGDYETICIYRRLLNTIDRNDVLVVAATKIWD